MTPDTVHAVMAYLEQRPYAEVAHLMRVLEAEQNRAAAGSCSVGTQGVNERNLSQLGPLARTAAEGRLPSKWAL